MDNCQSIQPSCHQSEKAIHSNFNLSPRVNESESCEVVLTLESVDQILWCDHSNETSLAVFSHGTIYLVCSSNF